MYLFKNFVIVGRKPIVTIKFLKTMVLNGTIVMMVVRGMEVWKLHAYSIFRIKLLET